MKRKKNLTGKAQFLPKLPAGDLESWMIDQVSKGHKTKSSPAIDPTGLSHPRSVSVKRDNESTSSVGASSSNTIAQNMIDRRHDMPLVRKRSDLSCRNSFDFMSDPRSVDEAMANLRRDYFAASSHKPRDALLQTWCKFHRLWYGNDEVVPLTVESLERVSCLFKIGACKSFKNYLSRIKELHTEWGYPWTMPLANAAKRCTRSVLRGLGGPVRSEAFDLEQVVNWLQSGNHVDTHQDGPRSPLAAVIVGVYFLLRELELSAIDMEDVSFTSSTVTLSFKGGLASQRLPQNLVLHLYFGVLLPRPHPQSL